jgi:hypothetical protein
MFFKDSVEIKKMPLKTAYDRSRDKTNNLKKLRDVVYSILESKGQKHTFIKVERGNVGLFLSSVSTGLGWPDDQSDVQSSSSGLTNYSVPH